MSEEKDTVQETALLQPIYDLLSSAIAAPMSLFASRKHEPAVVNASLAEYQMLRRLNFYDVAASASFRKGIIDDKLIEQLKQKAERQEFQKAADDINAEDIKAYAVSEHVEVGEKDTINTFIMDTNGERDMTKEAVNNVVLSHGFGSGLGFYFKTLEALALVPNWRVYAIDWLGMGYSTRSPLPPRQPNHTDDEDVAAVEDYFVESLERWREKVGLSQMVLVGHSLGGYLSAVYALKYPERVKALVLVSPAGVPHSEIEERQELLSRFQGTRRYMFQAFAYLWQSGYTPQGLVRSSPFMSRKLITNYVTRRFNNLAESELVDLTEYMHAITMLSGSGEYALGRLLHPGAWAKKPLEDRIPELKIPVHFIYGEVDWMDVGAAIRLETGRRLKPGSEVIVVPNAGHQVFLDNPDYFNEKLLEIITKYASLSSRSE